MDTALELLDVAIIGGGMAGLAAAWQLRDCSFAVFEASDRVGGRVKSQSRGDYWLNSGAHLFGGPGTRVGSLVSELGLRTIQIPGTRTGIALKNKIIASGPPELLPIRLPLDLGARISLAKLGLKLKAGARRFAEVERARPGESPTERRMRLFAFEGGRTLNDFVGPLHPQVAEILEALTERIATPPDVMAAGYGLASFGQVWSRNSLALNLLGGSGLLPGALAERMNDRIRTGCRVQRVEAGPRSVRIFWSEGSAERMVEARTAIIAAPADQARAMLRGIPEDTAAALGQISYGPFVIAAVLTSEHSAMPWDDAYAIATPGRSFSFFFNTANALRVAAPRAPGGSLMLYRGGRGAARLLEETDGSIRDQMLADLVALFPDAKEIVREVVVQRWPQGAPSARPGRAALQPALAKPLGRIALAGDYLEFASMEAAISTGVEAAESVRRVLEADHMAESGSERKPGQVRVKA